MLVSERIGTLKLYAQNIGKAEGGEEVHDAICRDLILPCIYTLTQFLESVKLDEAQNVEVRGGSDSDCPA